jgi:RHH-type rel operon transcriptional repressor/antitoxin RelB
MIPLWYGDRMGAVKKKATASKQVTVRLDEATSRGLDRLAQATARSRESLAAQAMKDFLEVNEWQIAAIENAIAQADSGDAKFIEADKIDEWLDSWGTGHERKPPQ